MMDDVLSLQRRSFLQQTAGVTALAMTGVRAEAAANVQPALVVYQPRDAASVAFAAALQAQGMAAVSLGDDPVRVWRDQLQVAVIDEGRQLMGRTSYATYFLLRGLAAEHRLFARHEPQPAGDSFDWLL